MKYFASIAVGVSLSLAACVGPSERVTQGEFPEDLARVLTDYEAAWQAQDAARLATLFTEDGYVLSSGFPPVQGRAAIRDFYTGKGGPLALRAFTWRTNGPVAYIIGGYGRDRGHEDLGKFTLTLSRDEDGHWWIVSDMDNGNAPARG